MNSSYILDILLMIIMVYLSMKLVDVIIERLMIIIKQEPFENVMNDHYSISNPSTIIYESTPEEVNDVVNDNSIVDSVTKELEKMFGSYTVDNSANVGQLQKLENEKDKFVDSDPMDTMEITDRPMTVENYQIKRIYQKLDEVNIPSSNDTGVNQICGITSENKDKVVGCIACKVNHRVPSESANENNTNTNIMKVCQYGKTKTAIGTKDIWSREECVAKCSTIPDYI